MTERVVDGRAIAEDGGDTGVEKDDVCALAIGS
jgi:hypothetical protein